MFQNYWIQILGEHLLTDISKANDGSLCIVNFLPSVDNFWVFGSTIFRDYYVYHNPSGVMGWVPTTLKNKSPLQKDKSPTVYIEFPYDFNMVYIKLGVGLFIWIGTWAVATYVFSKTFTGINFLNATSHTTSEKKETLVQKIESLSAESIEEMLAALKLRQEQARSNSIE